jgi:flagellar biosynthesis GTPase FlhF
MELKRILAKDLRRATEKAVALYGKDVLFVSNSRVNGMTEVIVAVEVMPEVVQAPTDLGNGAQFHAVLNQSFKALKNGATASAAPAIAMDESEDTASDSTETTLSHSTGNNPVDSASNQRDYIRGREIVNMVRDELSAMRKEFKLAQRVAMWQSPAGAHPAVQPLVAALAEAGIPVSLRTLLVDHINDMDDLQSATAALKTHLVNSIGEHHAKMPQSGIHAIAGPAGSGKTTMVAKLAKAAAERKGADTVAVISYSDQRAGAWSQIQMLCAQIGVDCLRANNPETLKTLLSELGTRKLILIDTPGVEVAMRTHEIVGCGSNIATHLVLSADASTTTIRKTLLDPDMKWASLMVARMDESTQPWPLIQMLCEVPVALSAASDSPKMSAPLRVLSAAHLVELAIQSLELDDAMANCAEASDHEQENTILTAAQALVQRIEKMPHAS